MAAALVLCAAAAEAAVFAQPAARCGALARTRAAAATMSEPEAVSSLPRFGRREALLLGVSGLGGWRYVSSGTAPTSLEGPIGTYKESIDMRGKTVLVTGANAGIGFETAKRLAEEGATVVMAGRSLERLGNAAERIRARYPAAILETLELDLASLASVRACAKAFRAKHATLDVLLNNAGVSAIPQRSETVDGNERIFQVNFLGHFLLTNLLMDALRGASTRSLTLTYLGLVVKLAYRYRHRLRVSPCAQPQRHPASSMCPPEPPSSQMRSSISPRGATICSTCPKSMTRVRLQSTALRTPLRSSSNCSLPKSCTSAWAAPTLAL